MRGVRVVAPENLQQRVSEAYRLATLYSRNLLAKYNVSEGVFSADDLAQDFILNFIQRGFAAKYDAAKSSLNRYVYLGVRNTLVSGLRKSNHMHFVDNEIDTKEGEVLSIFDVLEDPRSPQSFFSDLMKEEILSRISDRPFGYAQVVKYQGQELVSTVKSLVELFLDGFTFTELGRQFGVTSARVGQLLREAITPLRFVLV